jgi:hypothetical protein
VRSPSSEKDDDMRQRIPSHSRWTLFFERMAWNAAAGAVLAVMILVLLGSLRWLDSVAPRREIDRPSVSASGAASQPERPRETETVQGPSG